MCKYCNSKYHVDWGSTYTFGEAINECVKLMIDFGHIRKIVGPNLETLWYQILIPVGQDFVDGLKKI